MFAFRKNTAPNTEQREALRDQLDSEPETFGSVRPSRQGRLSKAELWWHEHFGWLKDHGYLLRQRYSPDWRPSWFYSKKHFYSCEDGPTALFPSRLLDATRLSDGKYVVLKLVKKSDYPFEVEIGQFFSSSPLAGASGNHCVPIYDVFQVPGDSDTTVIVMPLLMDYAHPPFETIGEVTDCFRQLLEGLQFMHKHRVAHRDCSSGNLMMDSTSFYIDAFHPVKRKMKRDFSGQARFRTRTSGPPKYFWIDFGLSRRYGPSIGEPLEPPIWGGDKEVPEFHKSNEPCNPFPTDVFYIGNMIRKDFIEPRYGFEFMESLVANMIEEDPSKRPTMDEVVERFHTIRTSLSNWKLRSRVIDRDESFLERVLYGTAHWTRRVKFMIKGVPAMPTPAS